MSRKIKQIAVSPGSDIVGSNDIVYALCEDGTIHQHMVRADNDNKEWIELPPIPFAEEKPERPPLLPDENDPFDIDRVRIGCHLLTANNHTVRVTGFKDGLILGRFIDHYNLSPKTEWSWCSDGQINITALDADIAEDHALVAHVKREGYEQ